ncbi:MAG: MBL fold metallo-hydrolase [bacterium]
MSIRIEFHGAAGTVTGSRYVVRRGEDAVMVDAGLFQGLKELRLLNWAEPRFSPRQLDTVLLTHAHLDHTGYLPRLSKLGFAGRILATPATTELSAIVLRDAARLQEEDAEFANKKGFSKHKPALPLFTERDAEDAIRHLRPVAFERWLEVMPGFRARWSDTGHLLGAAMIELHVTDGGRVVRFLFSGDVGRYGFPLHIDPRPRPEADVLVIESTYGDHSHPALALEEQLVGPLKETFDRRGVVMVPAFALGRSQIVLLLLQRLMHAGSLPTVPIHLDSPMAIDATEIYLRHKEAAALDPDVLAEGRAGLFPKNATIHRTAEESKALNMLPGPRIIIAGSGMLTGGRILHHLEQRVGDENNLVLLVGYQADGTRGRALASGAKTLRMHGRDVPVRARSVTLSGMSGHAGKDELLRWYRSGEWHPQQIFVTHGEPGPAAALAGDLRGEGAPRVTVPALDEVHDIQ